MSDYPMLISNKLHSFRNFTLQTIKSMTNLSNLFEWLKISNRPKHLKAGIIIFIIWIGSVLLLTTMTILQAALTGAICVFVAMCAVEYIQKSIGGKWDWLDILAGILLPIIVVLIIYLYGVFK